jgi:hypothetical protein
MAFGWHAHSFQHALAKSSNQNLTNILQQHETTSVWHVTMCVYVCACVWGNMMVMNYKWGVSSSCTALDYHYHHHHHHSVRSICGISDTLSHQWLPRCRLNTESSTNSVAAVPCISRFVCTVQSLILKKPEILLSIINIQEVFKLSGSFKRFLAFL